MKVIIVVIFLLVSFIGCDYEPTGTIDVPARRHSVPANAIWAGGQDGGSWILCSKVTGGAYICEVYLDTTGELASKKQRYDLLKDSEAVVMPSLPPYIYFDGIEIELKGNYRLTPVRCYQYKNLSDCPLE